MDIQKAVKTRRSIRRFKSRQIPPEMFDKLIDALLWAPSAGNLQARRFYFISNPGTKESLSEAALNQTFIARAPLVVVGCTDNRIGNHYGTRGIELYTIQDVSCSIMNMILVAHELGLGSVWVGAFYEEQVVQILDLPGHHRPIVIVPIGWPEKIPLAPDRVSPEDAVVWIR